MMSINASKRAHALGLAPSILLGAAALMMNSAASADVVGVGYVTQTSPRPNIIYSGSFGSYITSQMVDNGTQRTLVTVDLYGIMQTLGLNYLESVSIVDGGNNQYNSSPGADIDYFAFEGLGSETILNYGYAGPNTPHTLEGSAVLGTRIAAMDAVTGDQDYNCLHFVSLGNLGVLTSTFTTPVAGGGGGGGGGNGGPEEHGGSGGSGGPSGGFTNLVYATPGLKLKISEAGLGERYFIQIKGSAVPAPGAAALLSLTGLLGRRRRR
jgi:hypothetical protein